MVWRTLSGKVSFGLMWTRWMTSTPMENLMLLGEISMGGRFGQDGWLQPKRSQDCGWLQPQRSQDCGLQSSQVKPGLEYAPQIKLRLLKINLVVDLTCPPNFKEFEYLGILILESNFIRKIDFIFRPSFALFDPWSLVYQASRHWPNSSFLTNGPHLEGLQGQRLCHHLSIKKGSEPLQIDRANS